MPALSQLTMEHNIIAGNTAITDAGGVNVRGGGNSRYDLRRNQIISNTAGSKGGVWITGLDPTLVITSQNNLIARNAGSGLYLQDANFRSTNDTLADNGTYGIQVTGTFGISTTAWLTNTILWGHTKSFTSTRVPTYTLVATFSDIRRLAARATQYQPLLSAVGTITCSDLAGQDRRYGTRSGVDRWQPTALQYLPTWFLRVACLLECTCRLW
jgi:hypothetical protein